MRGERYSQDVKDLVDTGFTETQAENLVGFGLTSNAYCSLKNYLPGSDATLHFGVLAEAHGSGFHYRTYFELLELGWNHQILVNGAREQGFALTEEWASVITDNGMRPVDAGVGTFLTACRFREGGLARFLMAVSAPSVTKTEALQAARDGIDCVTYAKLRSHVPAMTDHEAASLVGYEPGLLTWYMSMFKAGMSHRMAYASVRELAFDRFQLGLEEQF